MTITIINYKLLPFCLCKSDPSIDTTTMSNVATKVAVIGGGISGAVCASTLAKNGISVTLFESARGPGGRMSQRREISEDGKELLFDHGAPFFSASNSDVLRLVHEWESKGLVEEWKENFGSFDCISKKFLDIEQEAPNKKYVGIPGMNSICKALCNETGVESKFGVGIGRLECLDDEKWSLTGLDGQNLGRFSGVVVSDKSIASPRFTDVTGRPPPLDLSLTPELALKLQDIPVSPCFALMLAFSEPLSSISVKGFSFKNSEIVSWSHCDSSKPGRSTARHASLERWVLHSTANYARGVIAQTGLQKPSSATLTKVAEELFQEFQSIGLNIPRPFFMKAHRWGSAFPTASIAREQKCLWDRKKRLAICGDFCVSPNVEGAILSGLAAASKLTEMLSCL
ncbi:renalase isoform X2 [Populus alba x Populus x berolinensis]|nr:renalase isoform X2 [Populus alba x Populus x berolinensis]